jgi:hypothetical protein
MPPKRSCETPTTPHHQAYAQAIGTSMDTPILIPASEPATSISSSTSDTSTEPSTPGGKRKTPMATADIEPPKRVKKESTPTPPKIQKPSFPTPVLGISRHGPTYDSNWYRSVLEEPAVAAHRGDNFEAVFEAYESLLMNQARLEYDLQKLTEIMFAQRHFVETVGEEDILRTGLAQAEVSDMSDWDD